MLLPTTLLTLAAVAAAKPAGCKQKSFTNLITFGDSYTDEGRLGYFINNGGAAPPPGTLLPPSSSTASGGYAWGRFVANYTGAQYYDYAVSGATCSNEIIERYFSAIDAPFPDVLGYEVPAFEADVAWVDESTGTNTLYPDREAGNTVYALWIGTNDLGFSALLSDEYKEGTDIGSFVDCIWDVFDRIYATGGRRFVLMNQAPLELSPMYASLENGGTGNIKFWTNKEDYNTTEYEQKILQYTTAVNTMFDYGVPFQLVLEKRWPGATVAVMDVNTLMRDIIADPERYLEGPADTAGYYLACDGDGFGDCVESEEDMASFLWYDELHPSERADDIIAKHFIDVVHGNSTYGTYWGSK